MYLRWKTRRWTRKKRNEYFPQIGESLVAVLVESERRDGKPRQRVVKHLASYETTGPQYVAVRSLFWETALQRLEALKLPEAEQEKITQALARRVKPLTPRQQELMQELQTARADRAFSRVCDIAAALEAEDRT